MVKRLKVLNEHIVADAGFTMVSIYYEQNRMDTFRNRKAVTSTATSFDLPLRERSNRSHLSDAQGRGSSRRFSASNIFEFAIALFIGEGNASRTLNEVPLESEKIVDALQAEIDGPRQTRDKICQAPSIE